METLKWIPSRPTCLRMESRSNIIIICNIYSVNYRSAFLDVKPITLRYLFCLFRLQDSCNRKHGRYSGKLYVAQIRHHDCIVMCLDLESCQFVLWKIIILRKLPIISFWWNLYMCAKYQVTFVCMYNVCINFIFRR